MESETTTAKVKRKAGPKLADGALEKYVIERIHRSQVKGAPYNPRTITDDARRKLRDNLERVGLLSPIVWNRRSGFVVSGHQRLSAMDALMGTDDYHLNVAAVDLDEKTEKEQNIFFNNPDAMGDWDFDKLGDMFKEGLDVAATGFDAGDIKDLFGGDVLQADDLSRLSDAVKQAHDMAKKIDRDQDTSQDNNFYLMLIFRDDATATRFAEWLGIKDSRFVDTRQMMRAFKVKIEEGAEIPPELLN